MNEVYEKEAQRILRNIDETSELLDDWERQFRLAGLPNEKKQAELEINRLKNIIAGYEQDYAKVHDKLEDIKRQELQTKLEQLKGKYDEKRKIIPKHLTSTPSLASTFLGRDKDLEKLRKLLTEEHENVLLLINGQGGVGKTSLAAKYYRHYTDEYQHLAWELADAGIRDATLKLAEPLQLDFPPEMETDKRLEMLLRKMANLPKPCLLVLDNANNPEDLQDNIEL